jgi:nucleotide-binding universal stress UspA family protein
MRVLVATDGSPAAGVGIDLVAGIAWPTGTSIRIVRAVETPAWLLGGPWPLGTDVPIEAIESNPHKPADSGEAARSQLERPGLAVSADVLQGRPATAIVAAARDWEADLVVVGSRGHGTIESMILGSVSAEVIDHARAPVLVARGRSIERVVLGWDSSDCSRVAAELLGTWPIFGRSHIRVVTVADTTAPWWAGFPETGAPETMPVYLEAAKASRLAQEALAESMASELVARGLDAAAVPRSGDAATGILAAAAAAKADLIVVGTHGWTGVKRVFLGSVARNVLHHATCSVLIARAPANHSRTVA